MDADDFCFAYRGCIAMCDPTAAPGGGFIANVVVVRGDDTLIAATPADVPFLTQNVAFEFSRGWAIRWIDANSA
jgi:hypothetical protein